MEKIKLGIIGISEGNGHPYSWSAIINGYDKDIMKNCPFPVIPEYLSKKRFPDDFLTHKAEVTHIYTQDSFATKEISSASHIKNIVDDPNEMIGLVDAILLARDDSENHLRFAKSFLKAGIPIYIDKPLALSLTEAKSLYNLQIYDGQIFTCSALRYASELNITNKEKDEIGDILSIHAYTPKSWEKYSVHIIEPILNILNFPEISDIQSLRVNDRKLVSFIANKKNFVSVTNLSCSRCPISIEIIGNKNTKKLIFNDPFNAFKTAIDTFLQQILTKKNNIPMEQTLKIIRIVQSGL
jgi:hypothetical protein